MYFSADAENCRNGDPLPRFIPYRDQRTKERIAYCVKDPSAPQGKQIIQWNAEYQGIHDQYNEVPLDSVPSVVKNNTIYMAFYFRFDRINGIDIWPEGAPDTESFDKAAELRGDGIRWIIQFGERGMGNKDHHYSVFLSNVPYQLNRELEDWDSYYQNYNGYSRYKSLQLDYEKWHSLVLEITLAKDKTGKISLWIDGIKVLQHTNIKTVAEPGKLELTAWNGTYAQPGYKIPPHVRKLDAILVTDNWDNIVKGGYLKNPINR